MKLRSLNEVMKPVNPLSLDEWQNIRRELIQNLRFSSSIDLLRHDAPLSPRIFDATEYKDYVVEKVIFQSLPGFYVAGNIYRPKDVSKRYPAVLNPHGHWEKGRIDMDPLGCLPRRCANFAMRGMVAFIYDMVGWNDSNQIDHNGYLPEFDAWNFSHFALQLNNSIKALDFICTLPYVDTDRIGCTGCSGGGTQTWFLAALDERVKAAAPINMVSAYMQGGCGCENAPFLRTRFCSVDYAMCIAPRPMFLAASDGDWTSHSCQVEFPAAKRVYSLYGAEDRLETFFRPAPHSYDLPTRQRAYDFFCRVFGLENLLPQEVESEPDPQSLLIGDIRKYVPSEGFIEGEEALFETVKSIMRANLKKLDDRAKTQLLNRVFPEMPSEALDIPYILDETPSGPAVRLAKCVDAYRDVKVKHMHAYNYGWDTRRVSALKTLMREYPERTFIAEGKSAYLVKTAAALIGNRNVSLKDIDVGEIDIPGFELAANIDDSPVSIV